MKGRGSKIKVMLGYTASSRIDLVTGDLDSKTNKQSYRYLLLLQARISLKNREPYFIP